MRGNTQALRNIHPLIHPLRHRWHLQAFHDGAEASTFWTGASTLQQGTRVPKALGDFLVSR